MFHESSTTGSLGLVVTVDFIIFIWQSGLRLNDYVGMQVFAGWDIV